MPENRPVDLERAGFTIIELMTVLALAAIVLGLAIPRFSGVLADVRLAGATSALVRDLRLAQSTARARAERVAVVVSERRYEVQRYGVPTITVSLPRGIVVSAVTGSHVIWFFSDGSSSGGFVTLRGATGANTVVVAAAPGLAYAIPGGLR
jgi:prepilin-type N-terminal cleavage/methylation domain-containing protein